MSFLGFVGPIATTAITLASSGTHNRRTALTLTNSMLASSVVTGTLKFSVGRARPYVTADSNSHDFQFNRGWHNDDYRSFPSGHSSLAFAFAAAISQERAHNQGRSREFDAAMYGTAALVGLSRIALDKHWFSDVLFGAGLGVT